MKNGITKEEKTAISSSTVINGDITAKEHLIINGTVKGNIQVKNHNLFIGPNGRLDGDVQAQNVRVRGQMRGMINADGKVEITQEANYSGKIICKNIFVEKGAYFDASVELGRESVKSKDVQKTLSETTFTELG